MTALGAVAGLLVAYVRYVIQYQRYSWESIWQFGSWWFIHYIAVVLIVGMTYVVTRGSQNLLFGRSETLRKLTLEEALIYGFLVVIVASVAMFVMAQWPVAEVE